MVVDRIVGRRREDRRRGGTNASSRGEASRSRAAAVS